MVSGKRILIIGAGPSGMSVLYHFKKMKEAGKSVPEIVCYEKQAEWGGLWNYSWQTGIDGDGEPVHGSMYKFLWSNGPKEASLEFPDYTFEEHFGKAIPSFPPREVLFDYLKGRWNKANLGPMVTFRHSIKNVKFDEESNNFVVSVKDLDNDVTLPDQRFDFVINASGHFSVPNVPKFQGLETFPGRILHAHDFRHAVEFQNKRILIIGASYSAEDISLQCVKYGAKSVICSYRTSAMGFKWPHNISERPLLTKVDNGTATFKDDSTAEVDAIIFATGYLNHYPWMEDSLRMNSPNTLYPPNLYKGTLWTKAGNDKLLYVGIQDQYYTYTMFDAQARWAVKYIIGDIVLPKRIKMEEDMEKWIAKRKALKNCHDDIDFQTDFVQDLADESDYGHNLDIGYLFHAWEHDKDENIVTYRDKSFTSKYTGTKSPIHHTKWFEALDDSMECYLNVKN